MSGTRDFNNIETRSVIIFFFLQVKATKEIQAILIEQLACFIPGRAKDLSAPLYMHVLLTVYIAACDLDKIRLAPDVPERNYLVSRKVSVYRFEVYSFCPVDVSGIATDVDHT